MATKKRLFTPPETVQVSVCRNGATIAAEVKWSDQGVVLCAMLDAFREAQKAYPELLQELQPVTSSMSVSGLDDEWAEEGRRKPFMGFSG
jgi:hypothetical protein